MRFLKKKFQLVRVGVLCWGRGLKLGKREGGDFENKIFLDFVK